MAPARLLERNVRPRLADDDESVEEASHDQSMSGDGSDVDESEEDAEASSQAGPSSERGEGASEEELNEDAAHDIGNVSFGALLEAQNTLSRKRKRGSETSADQDAKLAAVRARLDEIRSHKSKVENGAGGRKAHKSAEDQAFIGEDEASDSDDSDSDSAPSEEGAPSKSRSSKHAPRSQSSRYQVTRKRNVIDVAKRKTRDPRFDAIQQRSSHPGDNSEKAYSFLRDYQKDEIAELKTAIKQARSEDDKLTLRRKMVSMENQIKAKEAKERVQDVVKKHRREEKERVEQGKKPFYLKEKDIKERAMVEKFHGMKSKDREKLIERRRKKEGQKEKSKMPDARRVNG